MNPLLVALLGLVQQEFRLGIERPIFELQSVVLGEISPQLLGNKSFEEAYAYLEKTIADATDSFFQEVRPIVARVVKAHNDQLVASLAESNKSPEELMELCTEELAMAVMKRRLRNKERELRAMHQAGMDHVEEPVQTVDEVLGEAMPQPA